MGNPQEYITGTHFYPWVHQPSDRKSDTPAPKVECGRGGGGGGGGGEGGKIMEGSSKFRELFQHTYNPPSSCVETEIIQS